MSEIWDDDFRYIHGHRLGSRSLNEMVNRLTERAYAAPVPRQLYGSRFLDLLCMLTECFPERFDFRRFREDAKFIQTTTNGGTQWPDDFVEQLLARVRTVSPRQRRMALDELLLAGRAIQPSKDNHYGLLFEDLEAIGKLVDVNLRDVAHSLVQRTKSVPFPSWRRVKRSVYLFRMFAAVGPERERADVRLMAEDVECLERISHADERWPSDFIRQLGEYISTVSAHHKAERLVELLDKGRTIHPWIAAQYEQFTNDVHFLLDLANLPLVKVVAAIQGHATDYPMFSRSKERRISDLADLFELVCPFRPDFCLLRRFTVLQGFTIPRRNMGKSEIEKSLRNALDHIRRQRGPHSGDVLRVLAWLDTGELHGLSELGEANLKDLADVLLDATGSNPVVSLDQSQPDNDLVTRVFLPVVRMQVDRWLERLSGRLVPASTLVTMVDRAIACLRFALVWDEPEREPFPFDPTTGAPRFRLLSPKSLPWTDLDITIRLITIVKTASAQFLGSGVDLNATEDRHVSRALSSLQMMLQAAWLTSREIRGLLDPTLRSHWLRAEAELLASLHLVERGVGNCFRAGEYAICAVAMWNATSETSRGPTNMILEAASYAAELGVHIPERQQLHLREGFAPQDHSMLTRMPLDKRLRAAVDGITASGWHLKGFGIRAIDRVLKGNTVPDKVLADLFRVAFRRGLLAKASRLTSDREDAIAAQLTPDDLLGYADALAEAGQKLVHVLDTKKHNTFRRSLRKLWRHFPADKLTAHQHLFVHQVISGVSFNAVVGHRQQELALAYLSKAAGEDHFRSVSEHAASIRLGQVRGLLTSFYMDKGWLRVPAKTAFVSIAVRDGHTVDVLAFGSSISNCSGPSKQLEVVSTLGDLQGPDETYWTTALENYAAAMQRTIQTCAQLGVPAGRLGSWRIDELWRYIVDAARHVQPDVETILLHAAPFWDVIPWQHMLHCMEQRPSHLNLVVRVPGVMVSGLPNSKKKPSHMDKSSTADETRAAGAPEPVVKGQIVSDTASKSLETRLVEGAPERAPRTLTVVRHAERGAIGARFHGETDESTRIFINDMCGINDHVVLHTCHAASGSSSGTASDVDSLPVMFLAHGAQSVVAPGLPVSHETVCLMDRLFFGHPQDKNRFDVFVAYKAAMQANSESSLYTLYDRSRAPALVVTQFKPKVEWRLNDINSRTPTPTRATNYYRRYPERGLGSGLSES